MRTELDGTVFDLCDFACEQVAHELHSLPAMGEFEMRSHVEVRAKRLAIERYDAVAQRGASVIPCEKPICPPGGLGLRHNPSTRAE